MLFDKCMRQITDHNTDTKVNVQVLPKHPILSAKCLYANFTKNILLPQKLCDNNRKHFTPI